MTNIAAIFVIEAGGMISSAFFSYSTHPVSASMTMADRAYRGRSAGDTAYGSGRRSSSGAAVPPPVLNPGGGALYMAACRNAVCSSALRAGGAGSILRRAYANTKPEKAEKNSRHTAAMMPPVRRLFVKKDISIYYIIIIPYASSAYAFKNPPDAVRADTV